MRATSILGLGLIGFILLSILTIVLAGGWIANDLAERSLLEINAAGQNWANVDVSGRDVTVQGPAPDAEAVQQVLSLVEDVWGVRVAEDGTTNP